MWISSKSESFWDLVFCCCKYNLHRPYRLFYQVFYQFELHSEAREQLGKKAKAQMPLICNAQTIVQQIIYLLETTLFFKVAATNNA